VNTPLHPAYRFVDSISALAHVVLKETRATGYALFSKDRESNRLLRLASFGTEIHPETLLQESAFVLVTLDLHASGFPDGRLAFAFRNQASSLHAERILSRFLVILESLFAAAARHRQYSNLITQISDLEANLINSKIADRAKGLLVADWQPDSLDEIAYHVKTVLRPGLALRTMEGVIKELEGETEARQLIAQAKILLQSQYSFSEVQAYTHLRLLSRKSRRRLREVALDVIAEHAVAISAA